jgi:hypothetical protein
MSWPVTADDYDQALVDATSALDESVTRLYDLVEAAQEVLAAADADASVADGPPVPQAMVHLWNHLVDARLAISDAQQAWRVLNRVGQDWSAVRWQPYGYVDETTLEGGS